MPSILVKKLHPDAKLPTFGRPGDAGADLSSVSEDFNLYDGTTALIQTGLSVQIPEGYEMQVRPRSGLAIKGITVTNSPGTIDSGFRGEVCIILHKFLTDPDHPTFDRIKKGDRIAQAVICKLPEVAYLEVEKLSKTTRGEKGFGSTGVN